MLGQRLAGRRGICAARECRGRWVREGWSDEEERGGMLKQVEGGEGGRCEGWTEGGDAAWDKGCHCGVCTRQNVSVVGWLERFI